MFCLKWQLTFKLRIQFGNVIVIFSLKKVSGDRISQVVLLGELPHAEITSIASTVIFQPRLIAVDLSGLFVNQQHVTVQTGVFGRASSDVLGKDLTFSDILSGDVDHKPMVPFPEFRGLTARGVRVGHAERVQVITFGFPGYGGGRLHLSRGQDVTVVRRGSALVLHLQSVGRYGVYYVRNYLQFLHAAGTVTPLLSTDATRILIQMFRLVMLSWKWMNYLYK